MTELMEATQESEGQAERRVLTLLGGRCISEKALVIDGKIVWESRKNGYFHGYTDEIKNITESGITYIGNEKVFCDTLGQEKQIVICGAGHVSIPVIKMAVMMDCEVIVLEDRPMYADHARLAGASQVICEPFEEALDKIQGSADTYFVILTRGHRYDQICLEKIAAKEHAYIGMIGSRRRTALVKQSLAEKGVDQEVLDAVYTPIGLDIGAQTPAEIGVAIIAEIIEVKNRKKRTYGYSKEIMRALTAQEPYPEKKIMATIITRHGSAPQGLGTKMLIYRDGRCVGTIGGGCMEARVIQIAKYFQQKGYETEDGKLDAGKTTYFLRLIVGIVLGVGLFISVLSFYILMLSIFLLLQKNTTKLENLLLIGYSPARVARPYQTLTLGLNIVVLIVSISLVAWLRHSYTATLSLLFPQLEIGSLWPAITVGILLFVIVSAFNLFTIRKKVYSIWRGHH